MPFARDRLFFFFFFVTVSSLRTTDMRAFAALWVLCAARVSTAAASVVVPLPDRVHAVVKQYDGHDPTVDSVRVRNFLSELDTSPELMLDTQWCGRFDFRLVVDHCDCRDRPAAGGRPQTPRARRTYADYSMRVYANGGREHFSAEAKSQPRDAAGSSASVALQLPWKSLDDGRSHYGPVRMNARPSDGKPVVTVVPSDAFEEWAQQEAESIEHRLNFWNRSQQAAKLSRGDGGRRDIQVKLTYGRSEFVVEFAGDECVNLTRPQSSDNASRVPLELTVARGGCVLVFDDDRCSGPAPRTIVQQPASLYAVDGGFGKIPPATAAGARSVTGCCRRELDLKPAWKPEVPAPEKPIKRSDCSCGADEYTGLGSELVLALSRKYSKGPRAGQSGTPGERQLHQLSDLNEVASAAMETAKKATLSVATQDTTAGRNESVVAATAALWTVVITGKRFLAVLETTPGIEPQALLLLTEAVQITDRVVRRAKEATPETAVTLVVFATQVTTCVPAFIAWSYRDLAATADGNRAAEPEVETAQRRGRRAVVEPAPKSGAEKGAKNSVENGAEKDAEKDAEKGAKNAAGKGDGAWTMPETTDSGREKVNAEYLAQLIMVSQNDFEREINRYFNRVLFSTLAFYALITVCFYHVFEYVRNWIRGLLAPRILALVCYEKAKPIQSNVSA